MEIILCHVAPLRRAIVQTCKVVPRSFVCLPGQPNTHTHEKLASYALLHFVTPYSTLIRLWKKNCIYEFLKYFILQLGRNVHHLTDCLAAVRNMKYSTSFDLRPCSNVPADWLQSLAILALHMSLLGLRLKYRYS